MIDPRTIAELEKLSFTHIDARCVGCGRIVQRPFLCGLSGSRSPRRRRLPSCAVVTVGRLAVVPKQHFSPRGGWETAWVDESRLVDRCGVYYPDRTMKKASAKGKRGRGYEVQDECTLEENPRGTLIRPAAREPFNITENRGVPQMKCPPG